jgi:hypothetical protein
MVASAGRHHNITDQELKREGTPRDCPKEFTGVWGLGLIKLVFNYWISALT